MVFKFFEISGAASELYCSGRVVSLTVTLPEIQMRGLQHRYGLPLPPAGS
ncbi:MAG: hypothetical protein ACKPJJ_06265 [Planctomycetaceae bacterium]